MRLGQRGEEMASHFLRRKGYKIVERSYRSRLGEIDLIAAKDGVLVFCEVKTRLNKKFGEPFESVTSRKQKQLRKLAELYILSHSPDLNYRFDVVSIFLTPQRQLKEISHIENAFC